MSFMCGDFSNSISLGVHISREHSLGVCLPDVDFNFDLDFICGFRNGLEEENCDLDYVGNK